MQNHLPAATEDPAPQCPLHLAMRRVAEAAVTQHVYYTEGEMAPRPELLADLAAWSRLHTLTLRAVCPALRESSERQPDTAPFNAHEVDTAVRAAIDALPSDVSPAEREELRVNLLRCLSGSRGDPCPLR